MNAFRCHAVLLLLFGGSCAAAAEVPAEPLFSRHVAPLFSRLGCNAGSCHGAVKGQNGFRLTLFGADPALDHERLVREFGGRRIDVLTPDASLLLQKATGQVAHFGGKLFALNSPDHQIIQRWIAAGARLDPVANSQVNGLSVNPASHTLRPGERVRLRVEATFADGSTEDVTGLCNYESTGKYVAGVDRAGQVEALAPGDAALIVRYRGRPALVSIVVPAANAAAFEFPPVNFIDRHVADKLRRMNLPPADLSDDATFLRRVSLDITGALPTPAEVRAFLANPAADKRTKVIDDLLTRPGHTALWATRFCDILRPTGFDGKVGLVEIEESRRFYEWLRARLRDNTPYDQLAERILTATSLEGRPEDAWVREVRALTEENNAKTGALKSYAERRTLDLFWQRTNASGVKGAVRVSHAFLGLRLECAQCHRHPHDVWTQDDLLSFANFFMRVSALGSPPSPAVAKASDALTAESKKLKDDAKKLTDQAKELKDKKEEQAKLQAEAKALTDQAKLLDDAAKRLKGSEIHVAGKGSPATVVSPLGSQKSDTFRLLGAAASVTIPTDQDPRAAVVAWLRQPDNPFFARAIVNRVWAHYFGRGIVDPPDHLSPLNPPTHPELLDELARDFVQHGYDLRHLHRTIVSSRVYQLSARTNAANRLDRSNYASFYLRRLPAEVLVDAINHATGGSETYPPELRMAAGASALEVAGATATGRETASMQYAFQIFGRPLRNADVACDCERDPVPTVVQALYLTNHPRVRDKLASPTGRVAQVIKEHSDPTKRIEEAYLWTLSRLPLPAERDLCLKYLQEAPSPQRGLEDVVWSLLNTQEFIVQH